MIAREAQRLATAATFLTRLPWVAKAASPDPVELGRSARWFPLIGVVVGAIGGGVYVAAAQIWPTSIASILALVAMVLATGAFHEDGWADAFDGLFGGWTVQRRLEIMRDSRIGTYGALALLLLVLAKWQALASLAPLSALLVLITAHAAARWSTLVVAQMLPYARDAGAMKPVATGIGPTELLIGTIVLLATMVVLGQGLGWWLVATGAVTTLLLLVGATALFRARLGGVTGDCLGAANQAVELAWLLLAAAFVSA